MPEKRVIPPLPKFVHVCLQGDVYREFGEDTPARAAIRGEPRMGYLKDFPEGTEIEVFTDGSWKEGFVAGKPSELIFHVSVITHATELVVGQALHQRLYANHGVGKSPLCWMKLIPPSKQVGT